MLNVVYKPRRKPRKIYSIKLVAAFEYNVSCVMSIRVNKKKRVQKIHILPKQNRY